jgi:hypothetical protein
MRKTCSTSAMASSRVAFSAGTTAIIALCMALASVIVPLILILPDRCHPNCFWNVV